MENIMKSKIEIRSELIVSLIFKVQNKQIHYHEFDGDINELL